MYIKEEPCFRRLDSHQVKFEGDQSLRDMAKCLVLLFLFCASLKICSCDDFPSLLTANASIAIVLDREYLDSEYEDTLKEVKVIVEKVLREDLKNGGLIVSYYSWTRINLKKDFSAVFSITNCENTWEIFKDSRSEHLLLLALTDPGLCCSFRLFHCHF